MQLKSNLDKALRVALFKEMLNQVNVALSVFSFYTSQDKAVTFLPTEKMSTLVKFDGEFTVDLVFSKMGYHWNGDSTSKFNRSHLQSIRSVLKAVGLSSNSILLLSH